MVLIHHASALGFSELPWHLPDMYLVNLGRSHEVYAAGFLGGAGSVESNEAEISAII